jgi:hypothetical protein
VPTATSPPPPPATQPPPSPIPVSGALETFLSDARQTEADLAEIRNWIDQADYSQGIWTLSCAPVHGHSIHQPVSTAPAADPNLAGIWHEYSAALASGQEILDWFVQACTGEKLVLRSMDFTPKRDLTFDVLSQAENVVRALEALQ